MTERVLRILQMTDPHRLTVPVLLSEVRLQYGACGESELTAALKGLQNAGLAVPEVDGLTGDTRWALTAKGRGHEL